MAQFASRKKPKHAPALNRHRSTRDSQAEPPGAQHRTQNPMHSDKLPADCVTPRSDPTVQAMFCALVGMNWLIASNRSRSARDHSRIRTSPRLSTRNARLAGKVAMICGGPARCRYKSPSLRRWTRVVQEFTTHSGPTRHAPLSLSLVLPPSHDLTGWLMC